MYNYEKMNIIFKKNLTELNFDLFLVWRSNHYSEEVSD